MQSANWMQHFDEDQQHHMISIMEYAVLGTDMGLYHNPIRTALKDTYTESWVTASYERTLSMEEKKFVVRAMLHLSDISNPMRPFKVGWEWANRVNQEFFAQGDEMKAMKLEVTKNCDRDQTTIVSNQSGFVQFCLKPLAELMSVLIHELEECLENIPVNLEILSKVGEGKNHEGNQAESEEFVMVEENSSAGHSKI